MIRTSFRIIDIFLVVIAQKSHGVIVTDWSKLSNSKWYPKSRKRISIASGEIGQLLRDLVNSKHTTATKVHCLGHSLGAHTCGLAGKHIKIGRITGSSIDSFHSSLSRKRACCHRNRRKQKEYIGTFPPSPFL